MAAPKRYLETAAPVNRLVILSSEPPSCHTHLQEITAGSTFLYGKEHALLNALLEACMEMMFTADNFRLAQENLLQNGSSDLTHYAPEINDLAAKGFPRSVLIELHSVALSTNFKIFLLLAKAALDKLVPLYSYQFYDTPRTFRGKGVPLVKAISQNKRVRGKDELVALIEDARADWLGELIDLRDEYAHFSSLKSFQCFSLNSDSISSLGVTGISDFDRPAILTGGTRRDALDYVNHVSANLRAFLHQFLLLCDFGPDRRPRHYLKCECGFEFARRLKGESGVRQLQVLQRGVSIAIISRELRYGVISCPKCGENTDADLDFWGRFAPQK
jgi:hypothetical protein